MKVPEWFISASCIRPEKRRPKRVVLLSIPVCADCGVAMSSTPLGLICFSCGGDRVKR